VRDEGAMPLRVRGSLRDIMRCAIESLPCDRAANVCNDDDT